MKILRIGTRESQLAVWQAKRVQQLLAEHNINSELVLIKSEGDIDLVTPLYALGVQGVFTRTLDAALLRQMLVSCSCLLYQSSFVHLIYNKYPLFIICSMGH